MRFIFVIFGILALIVFVFFYFRKAPLITESPFLQEPNATTLTPSSEYSKQAVLKDVAGDLAVGLATQKIIGEDFMVLVDAQLTPPPEEQFYFGWLVKHNPELNIVPLGRLNPVSDTSNLWQVAFRSTTAFTDYEEVWVTKEKTDDDQPETIILKGKWK